MNMLNDFAIKQRKYMPHFPKANGKPTVYIQGYPYEDDEPMSATGYHGEQIRIFSDQVSRYFQINPHIYIGIDSFIYYREGDITKFVAPDVYIVFGVDKYPQRRSFYTWSEGAVPTTIFEFLSDSTAHQDRARKIDIYLREMGCQEYFIHQPEMEKPAEFRGWRRSSSGTIMEMPADREGSLFSESLNLYFRWEDQLDSHVRLLRPYLPDGTAITTSIEEQELRIEAEMLAADETQRRQEAEALAAAETQRRMALETELERLRAQLAERQDENV